MVEMKKYKLGDIADFDKKTLSKKDSMDVIEYLDTGSLTENIFGPMQVLSRQDAPSRAQRRVFDKTILYSTVRPRLKHYGFMEKPKENVIVSTGFVTIDVKDKFKNVIDPYYLYLLLIQDEITEYLGTIADTAVSSYPSLNPSDIQMLEFEFPDLSIQKKIASVPYNIDKRIENLRAQNRVLEQTAKTIYDYTFLQCAGHQTTYNKTLNRNIPAGWEVKSVGDFAELITKGTTPTTLGFNFEENGVNFVKVECIENGRLITENLAHISKEAHEKLKRSNLHENDILVTIAGRLASSCVVPKSVLPANTNQAVGIIRLTKENQKYVQYVFYCIFDPAMQNKLKGINAQSIQKNLTLPNLGNIPIAVPDDKTLEEFNSQVIPIFRKQLVNSQQIESLTTQRNTLLPLLMTGKIEV